MTKVRDLWYVPDPNKAGGLEKLREKALLKESEEYKEVKKKLKVFRLEGCPRWIQEILAGVRLRRHRRCGRQDP